MDVLESWEIRWFFPGNMAPEVIQWFSTLPKKKESIETRPDYYLSLLECDYIGIKLRGGKKLEIKHREIIETGFTIQGRGGKITGNIERWTKWDWVDSEADERNKTILVEKPNGPSLKVEKKRLQNKYEFLSDGSIEPVIVDAKVSNGCLVEITRLDISGTPWYSIAAETFGQIELGKENLKKAIEYLFHNYSGPKLELNSSYGYPKWLIQMTPFSK